MCINNYAVYLRLLSKLCLKDQRTIYSINTYCLSVTTGLDKLLINYNLVNLRYKNSNYIVPQKYVRVISGGKSPGHTSLIVLNRKNKETGFSTYLKNLPRIRYLFPKNRVASMFIPKVPLWIYIGSGPRDP